MGWNEWSNGKRGGIIAGATVAGLAVIGAAVGIGIAVSKPSKKLDMWVPWTDTTVQYKSLEQITDLYNKLENPEYKVYIHTAGAGGYKESGFTETSNLLINNLNHAKKLPDMVINNQDAIAILNGANRAVNLKALGLDTEDLQLGVQDAVSGVVKQGGDNYSIRFYSTQNMGLDVPLINWFIKNSDGRIKNSSSITEIDGTTISAEDNKTIENNWKVKDGATTSFVIQDDTFESQEGIHEFANAILDNFVALKDGKEIDIAKDNSRGVIAYTNPQTEFLTSTQAFLGGVSSTTPMINVADNGNEYRFLTDEEQYNKAGIVWEDFRTGMTDGSYWLPGSTGLYSSSMVANHYSPITIGSTSGTSFNVGKDAGQLNSDEIYYLNDYSRFEESSPINVYKSQGPSLMAVNRNLKDQSKRNEEIIDFMNWLISSDKVASMDASGNITQGTDMTAGTAFSILSDFLLDSKGAFDYVGSASYDNANEPGLKLTYDTITDSTKSANLFSEPNDKHTGEFWNTVKSEMNNQQSAFTESGKAIADWDTVAGDIVKQVNNGSLDARGNIEQYKASLLIGQPNVVSLMGREN